MKSFVKKLSLVIALFFLLTSSISAQNPRRSKAVIKTSAECMYCKKSIEKTIGAIDGVRKVSCDYQKHEVNVMYNANKVSLADIKKAMNELGYDADDQPANNSKSNQLRHKAKPQ